MKKIVIIGANSFQNRLILKAKELGYETHVFAWQCGDIGEYTADYFYPISIIEKEEILKKCRLINPDAIASIASDLAVLTVNYVARNLGLTANSEICDRIATNKYEMRRALSEAGIPTPAFYKITEEAGLQKTLDYTHPWIVKPTDRSGSRGVTKVINRNELGQAIASAQEQSFEKSAIVEEFIDGTEYSAECISYKGIHHLLAVTEKFTTGAPHFIETGHLQPALTDVVQRENLKEIIFSALDALDIKYGASHSEFKITQDGGIRIIEIGARMGGDCIGSDLVFMSTGNDFVKMVIDVASGQKPEILQCTDPKPVAVRFIMNKSDLLLLEKPEIHITDKVDISNEFQHEVVDSSTRFGYFLATGGSREELKQALFNQEGENR